MITVTLALSILFLVHWMVQQSERSLRKAPTYAR